MNTRILFIIIALLAIATGCAQQTGTGGLGTPFVGGTEGLTMKFVTGAPPEQVFDNSEYPFSATILLENRGEYDIEAGDGFIELQGISPDEFGVSSADMRQDIPEIRGVSKNSDGSIIKGGTEAVSFENLEYQIDAPGNLQIDNFRVRACYDYETKSSTQICLKRENIDAIRGDEICKIEESKDPVNSGAPIQVLSVLENTRSKTGISVTLEIGPVGTTTNKWFPSGDAECDDKITNRDLYRVEVEVAPIVNGRYSAKCSGGGTFAGTNSGLMDLYNGQPQKIICSFDTPGLSSDFETQLDVKLKYRYLQYIERPLLIKDLGKTD